MKSNTYHTAKKITFGALILSVLSMLYFLVMYIGSCNGVRYFGGTRDIVNAIDFVGMPIVCAASVMIAFAAVIAAAVSKKRGDIGTGRLIAADIAVMAVMGAPAFQLMISATPLSP
jgi:hypothetical protein